LTMLTVAAIAPPRWPNELSGTILVNQSINVPFHQRYKSFNRLQSAKLVNRHN